MLALETYISTRGERGGEGAAWIIRGTEVRLGSGPRSPDEGSATMYCAALGTDMEFVAGLEATIMREERWECRETVREET